MGGDEMEMIKFIKVWLSVAVSLCYCYCIGTMVPKGGKRLCFVLPVVCLFLYLPLVLSSVHLGGTTGFFVGWLANFKLFLFAFGKGPLCSDPSISLQLFIAVACLPIKLHNQIKQNPSDLKSTHQNGQNNNKVEKTQENSSNIYAIKALLLAAVSGLYVYRDSIHPKLILLLYTFHVYFFLELILAASAALARSMFGLEVEPHFNEPYLSTSLQDFWGKRWNLIVSSILRPTVYGPTLRFFTRITGRKWAPLPAVFATFLVSGVMHEQQFYYMGQGRIKPTGGVAWFFVFHGLCLAVEIGLKKAATGKFRFPSLISRPLTVGFLMVTGFWWFFPHFGRYKIDVKAVEEYTALCTSLKYATQKIFRIR